MLANLHLNGTAPTQAPEQTARTIFRESIAEVADSIKATLPNSHGRIEKAITIVLQDDVLPFEDGHRFAVGSQSDTELYYVLDDECSCPDSDRAPDGYCKHVISTWLYRRGTALATERMRVLNTPYSSTQSLPEAPASANVYLMIQGRKVQLTLRDHDENALLARMELLLTRFPDETPESDTKPVGWCPIHDCQMRRSKQGNGWYHKAGERPKRQGDLV